MKHQLKDDTFIECFCYWKASNFGKIYILFSGFFERNPVLVYQNEPRGTQGRRRFYSGTEKKRTFFNFSWDPNSDHSKTGFIQNPDILKVGLQTIRKPDILVRFSNGLD